MKGIVALLLLSISVFAASVTTKAGEQRQQRFY
jgi:hypothetical protein